MIRGTWDEALLARMLAELESSDGIDLSLTGFGEEEVQVLLRSLNVLERRDRPETFDLDGALGAARGTSRTQPGDLRRLDDHLLLCGDATQPGDVQRLLDDRRAAMAITDPPYNVDLGRHGGHQRGSPRRRIANDALPAAECDTFVRAWAAQLLERTDGAVYAFISSKEWPTVARILAEAGGHWSDTLIWSKEQFTLGRGDYQRAYEPISYGWRNGVQRRWCGPEWFDVRN